MNKKLLVWGSVFLGIIFIIIAFMYFITPVNHLPHFFPGFDAHLTKTHYKHGLGAFILGLGLFILAWFQSGKKKSSK